MKHGFPIPPTSLGIGTRQFNHIKLVQRYKLLMNHSVHYKDVLVSPTSLVSNFACIIIPPWSYWSLTVKLFTNASLQGGILLLKISKKRYSRGALHRWSDLSLCAFSVWYHRNFDNTHKQIVAGYENMKRTRSDPSSKQASNFHTVMFFP